MPGFQDIFIGTPGQPDGSLIIPIGWETGRGFGRHLGGPGSRIWRDGVREGFGGPRGGSGGICEPRGATLATLWFKMSFVSQRNGFEQTTFEIYLNYSQPCKMFRISMASSHGFAFLCLFLVRVKWFLPRTFSVSFSVCVFDCGRPAVANIWKHSWIFEGIPWFPRFRFLPFSIYRGL